jgi:hypothetical protein
MRDRVFAIAGVLVLVAAAAAGIAYAQQPVLRVTIPFAFMVENQTLPAGEYRIERAIATEPNCLRISDAEGHALKVILTNGVLRPSDRDLPAKLMFDRYGNQYFLTQVWPAWSAFGQQLPPSAAEKELARRETKQEVALLISTGAN